VIFVDSSAWYARYTPSDRFHQAAIECVRNSRSFLVTTDYVVDETLTLFRARGNNERALLIGKPLLAGELAELIWVQPDDVHAAWSVYERFQDKRWSFTDCVSYVVMQRLQVTHAMAFDEHFRQFGIVSIIP
jgi:uncharacterized protein